MLKVTSVVGVVVGDTIPVALRAALAAVSERAGPYGRAVVYVEQVGSTNDVAERLAGEGAPEGTLVVAASQTHGRGRQGRRWLSPPGAGLYFSLVLRPGESADPAASSLLTLAAGVAVADGIERACGLAVQLKWPNDLVSRVCDEAGWPGAPSQRRKVAGLLAEGAVTGGVVQHVVLGIGINVSDAAYPPGLADRATSLEHEVGHRVAAFGVLGECLVALADRLRRVRDGQARQVLDEWRRRSPSATGAPVLVSTGHGRARGVTCGLNDDGSLAVAVGDTRIRVVAGEVEWL